LTYLFANSLPEAQGRLRRLEAIEDGDTQRRLVALGVARGWHSLEVGAGAGAVAGWLCERVGLQGHVVATDIDARFLRELPHANLEIREHDLASAPLEPQAFDLVHARHVLFHVPADHHSDCVQRLAASLRSGGAILLEESDFASLRAEPWVNPAARDLHERVTAQIHDLYRNRGLDVRLGAGLLDLLHKAGVVECEREERVRIVRGGTDEASFHRQTYAQLRAEALTRGGLSDCDFDAFLALHDDPDFAYRTRTTVAAWGRKRATA
jgi:SAM-dependent methyltransferase